MTPDRWQRVKELFLAALDREPAERGGFLGQACGGDTSLRSEVESLLAHHDQGRSFLEQSPGSLTGRRLGPYQVLAELGRGGMGAVYLAEDTRLNRKTALKVLPPEFAADPEPVTTWGGQIGCQESVTCAVGAGKPVEYVHSGRHRVRI